MSWAEVFMKEAQEAVARRSKTTVHKIGTMVWYTGRKQLRSAPRKAISSIGSVIAVPIVSTLLNTAVEKALDKVDKSRKLAKRIKYHNPVTQTLDTLRSAAKADAKSLKEMADKISSNQPKLKDASLALKADIQVLSTTISSRTAPTKDQLWKVALGIYERERYEDKILVLLNTAQEMLSFIEKYVEDSKVETTQMEADFLEMLAELESEVLEDPSNRARQSSQYARL